MSGRQRNTSPTMTISLAGLELIKGFEAFAPRRYICPAGKPTIAFGHVILPGETFQEPISMEIALDLLRRDCAVAEDAVVYLNTTMQRGRVAALEQHEFDALVSFVFNVGVGAFGSSTLRRKLVEGDRAGAAEEFLRWNKVKGKPMPGLTRRRTAERAMFLNLNKQA